ncbi:Endonuclease/exonuclease/phosphatase, partial [Trema orientale]
RGDVANVQERIDRFICNESWRTLFPLAAVENLDFYKSNHRPILLTLTEKLENQGDRHDRPFRFEPFWVNENDCMEIVNSHWGSFGNDIENDSFRDISVQLAGCGDKLAQ